MAWGVDGKQFDCRPLRDEKEEVTGFRFNEELMYIGEYCFDVLLGDDLPAAVDKAKKNPRIPLTITRDWSYTKPMDNGDRYI